jgi:NAD(P)H-flavin reductase
MNTCDSITPVLTLPIREVLDATPRARIVRISLDGARLTFLAGQAVYVGAHGQDRRKPYSIASAPEETERDGFLELLVGVTADGEAGPHLTLLPGALVDVDGPVGRFTFPVDPREKRFVFVAGGTGIAPLRAMLRHALLAPERQIGVFYSARTAADFAYETELRSLAHSGRIELRQTITRETPSGDWHGTRGRIGRAELAPLVHDAATLCFVCGPPALVEEMPKLLEELGVPRQNIKIEEWT